MQRYVFYCIPPTPNGDLHLGHLSGPYLGADILTRYLRARGCSVHVLTGIDDYQSYTFRKGLETGCTPEEVIDLCSEKILNSWRNARMGHDLIVRTHRNPSYAAFIRQLFGQLEEKGCLPSRCIDHLSSSAAGFAYQGMIHGRCPWCGTESDGNICEVCSLPNECTNLIDPASAVPGDTLRPLKTTRRYFKLRGTPYMDAVKEWHQQVSCNESLREYFKQLWAKKINEVSVTHQASWGLEAAPGSAERIDVWFEMGLGFLYYADRLFADWRSVWHGQTEIGIFFGYDNSFYTSVLFPGALKALDEQIVLPRYLFVNHFLNLDGEKFSTSRSHAIWGSDFFRSANPNWGRLYLASVRSETARSNFSLNEYLAFERRMSEQWNAATAKIISAAARCELEQKEVDPGFLGRLPGSLVDTIRGKVESIRRHMRPEEYVLSQASADLQDVFNVALAFCNQAPLMDATGVEDCFALLASIGEFARPWMPGIDASHTLISRNGSRTDRDGSSFLPSVRVTMSDRIYI